MGLQLERWRALRHLDEWLRTPMLLLSLVFIGRDAEEDSGPVAGAAELRALKAEVSALRRAIESANASRSVAGATPPA